MSAANNNVDSPSEQFKSPQVRLPALLLISTGFWLFVTLSNVLYAHSMQVNADQMANTVLWAPWDVRVLQHLTLFPLLFACFAVSLRAGWKSLRCLPLQVLLGIAFASLSYFAMTLSESIYSSASARYFGVHVVLPSLSRESFGALWTASFSMFFMTYCFGVALVTGFAFYQRVRDAELRNIALKQGWDTARLAALRMQLSPHTLFNLLHTIRGHIIQEPHVARSMVVQLADLLRRLLNASQRDFSLLKDELTFVRLYLELQQQRFGDRLSFLLPDAMEPPAIWVPSLILQPLVENAVVHGLAGHDGLVMVRIEALTLKDVLTLRVINSIAEGLPVGRDGIGLANVRERLDVQFGAEASLSAGPKGSRNWVVQIRMPVLRELSVIVESPSPTEV
jgi:Histidine kinase